VEFSEKHQECVIFVVDFKKNNVNDFKKIMFKKIFFTTFTLWLTIFFTHKNVARIARKNFFQANFAQ
jgi:hypothetical protein